MTKKFIISALALVFSAALLSAQGQQMPTIPNDPAVRIGKLDNGLTYYIRHNELPKERAEFYLATNTGGIYETVSGICRKIDDISDTITVGETVIPIDDISSITSPLFGGIGDDIP